MIRKIHDRGTVVLMVEGMQKSKSSCILLWEEIGVKTQIPKVGF